jgi:hypothetical protein
MSDRVRMATYDGTIAAASPRERMLESVEHLGVRACSYSVGPDWALLCDCKYGIESDVSPREPIYCGEQTGCPELRDVYSILKAMTDEEFTGLRERIAKTLAEAWQQHVQTNRTAGVEA